MKLRRGVSEAYTVLVLVSLASLLVGVVFYVSSSHTNPVPVASVTYTVKTVEKLDNGGYKTVITIANSGDILLQVRDVVVLDSDGNVMKANVDYTGNIEPRGGKGLIIIWSDQKPSSVSLTICVEGYCYVKYINIS